MYVLTHYVNSAQRFDLLLLATDMLILIKISVVTLYVFKILVYCTGVLKMVISIKKLCCIVLIFNMPEIYSVNSTTIIPGLAQLGF